MKNIKLLLCGYGSAQNNAEFSADIRNRVSQRFNLVEFHEAEAILIFSTTCGCCDHGACLATMVREMAPLCGEKPIFAHQYTAPWEIADDYAEAMQSLGVKLLPRKWVEHGHSGGVEAILDLINQA